MFLREEHLVFATVSSAPLPHTALERTQRTWPVFARMAALEFLQQGDGAQMRAALQERQQFRFSGVHERIRARTPPARGRCEGGRCEGSESRVSIRRELRSLMPALAATADSALIRRWALYLSTWWSVILLTGMPRAFDLASMARGDPPLGPSG
jgi:hypothetical protein